MKFRVLFEQQDHSLTTNDFMLLCTPALNPMGMDPWVTVQAAAREAPLTDTIVMFLYCLLSVFWLSSLRGFRSCGCDHGLSLLAWAVRFYLLKYGCMFSLCELDEGGSAIAHLDMFSRLQLYLVGDNSSARDFSA